MSVCVIVFVCECMCIVGMVVVEEGEVCVQEIKNSSAPQPAAGGLLKAGDGTSSSGPLTPPSAVWETGRSQKYGGASFL